nr:uncharacterized protein LOC117990392 [Maniola hyperantus]
MPDFSKLCRACLTAIDSNKYNLFEDVSPDVYWFCTNIEVVKDENLPRSICKTCYDLIKKFSEFKKTCLQSQNTLLNYYSVAPKNKKLDWLNNDPREKDTQKVVSQKFEVKLEDVTVKDEDIDANYDDFDSTELHVEVDVKVKKNKSHKKKDSKFTNWHMKLKCPKVICGQATT